MKKMEEVLERNPDVIFHLVCNIYPEAEDEVLKYMDVNMRFYT